MNQPLSHHLLTIARENPQHDEFFCAGESYLRAEDFAELGWTETLIWGV